MTDVAAILETIATNGVKVVDFRFTDLAGRWRHTSREVGSVDAEMLGRGVMIDGSAVAGWRDVTESDLLLKPDLGTSWLDPFAAQPTLAIVANGAEPSTGLGYERDPRSCAERALALLAESRVADQLQIGAEIAFFLFDNVQVEIGGLRTAVTLTAGESDSDAGQAYAQGNRGHRPVAGAAYLAMPPADHAADLRAEMATVLATLGFGGIFHQHGAGASKHRLGFAADDLLATADRVQLAKHVVQQVAASYGKSATFMPKPLADQPGSALNLHLSLWHKKRPLFAGQGYADLSQTCLQFIAGVVRHARALNAFTNPTTNSYKRLRQGQDEPTLLAYAAHNRSAAIRIPYAAQPAGKRLELRFPDPCANPYLAFTALLMAGLDGIERKLDPGEAVDRNLYDLPAAETGDFPTTARSLREALAALAADHEFLMKHDVMPIELIEAYIDLKTREADAVDAIPHPAEFRLYYGM